MQSPIALELRFGGGCRRRGFWIGLPHRYRSGRRPRRSSTLVAQSKHRALEKVVAARGCGESKEDILGESRPPVSLIIAIEERLLPYVKAVTNRSHPGDEREVQPPPPLFD